MNSILNRLQQIRDYVTFLKQSPEAKPEARNRWLDGILREVVTLEANSQLLKEVLSLTGKAWPPSPPPPPPPGPRCSLCQEPAGHTVGECPATQTAADTAVELLRTREVLRQLGQYFGDCAHPLAAAVQGRLAWPGAVRPCPRCGSATQVWPNQLTGKLTCHRSCCQVEVGNGEVTP